MNEPFRFYSTDSGEVVDEAILTKSGLDTPEKIENAFVGELKLKEVWFNPSKGQAQLDINRKCQAYAERMQNPADREFIEPYARIEVMVEKWNGFTFTPTIEHALDMHPNIIGCITVAILNHMYPSIYNNANFIQASRKLQENSAPETPAS